MSIKRIVDTSFWEDSKVIDKYSVEDKYFLLYLMTNPHTTQVGIYKLPRRLISFETGYTVESVSVILERFESKYGNIVYDYETQEIAVLNSLKYSIVKGGKPVSDLLTKELSKIKNDELILKVYENLMLFWERSTREFDKTVKELFEAELAKRNVPIIFNDNVNDNDNDNEDSYPESYDESCNESLKNKLPYQEIIEYLNQKAKTKFRYQTKTTQEKIRARFNEGFTLDDFKIVIDKKSDEWLNDKNMNQYLRPETLFGTKFEGYLNQPFKQQKRGAPNVRTEYDLF